MRRAGTFWLVATLILATTAFAQIHPNVDRGFAVDKIYDFGNLDHVNTFNGNLILTIPIGQPYQVSSALTYGFNAVYNSNVWDLILDGSTNGVRTTWPNRRANAGMGWQVTLGRLLSGMDPTSNLQHQGDYLFVSPDGSEHALNFDWPIPPNPADATWTSEDGTFIHLHGSASNCVIVEMPDGRSFCFTATDSSGVYFRLASIFDRFGNWVTVSYPTVSGYSEVWQVADSQGRLQKLYFKDAVGTTYPQQLLDHVELKTFNGVVATWKFNYGYRFIARGPEDQSGAGPINVALLRYITTPDDTGAANGPLYSFITPGQSASDPNPDPYYNTAGSQSGTARGLQLPTGGWLEWDFADLQFPQDPDYHDAWPTHTVGVQTRRQMDRNRATLGSWSYLYVYGCGGQPCPNPHFYNRCGSDAPRQLVTMTTAPDQTTTVHYYSIFVGGPNDDGSFCLDNDWGYDFYGLPWTSFAKDADGRRLSWEVRTGVDLSNPGAYNLGPITSGTVIRSAYVNYTADAWGIEPPFRLNGREQSVRTSFDDDRHCGAAGTDACYETINRYSYAFGHFRQESRGGNFPGKYRTTFTNYFGSLANKIWILNPYTEQCTADEDTPRTAAIGACSDLPNSVTAKFQFDRSTGFLLAKRTLVGAALSAADLLATFTPDAHGSIEFERYYGGDTQALTDPDPFTPPATAKYEIHHQDTYDPLTGALQQRQTDYPNLLKTLDLTIEANTGLPSRSKDSSGLATDYGYDTQSRRTSEKPPGQAWTKYTYHPTDTPPSVVVEQWPNGAAASGTPLTERRLYFDGLGRLTETRVHVPDGVPPLAAGECAASPRWSVTQTKYDALGRISKSSMPECRNTGDYESFFTPAHWQQFQYDIFGRATSITAPDNKVTTMTYTGARVVARKQIVNAANESITTENYDSLGRLASVVEPGSNTTTTYTYDAGDRLSGVSMDDGTPSDKQTRTFHYDGRGFLVDETHPELGRSGNGTITYDNYDAQGHAGRKLTGSLEAGKTASDFDLSYTYDGAERLVAVDQILNRDPNGTPPTSRPLKQFSYATDDGTLTPTNHRTGKLDTAVRYNYPSSLAGGITPPSGKFIVTETFFYQNNAGILSSRNTKIEHDTQTPSIMQQSTQSYTYDDLGQVTNLTYPNCPDGTCSTTGTPLTTLVNVYSYGRLSSVTGYATAFAYHPSGMVSKLIHGQNGGTNVTDTITADDSGMARPKAISFDGWDDCVPPTPSINAAGEVCPSSGGNTASVTPVTGATYQWTITNGTITSGATSASMQYTAPASGSVVLSVSVSSSCGSGSNTKSVVVGPTAQITSGNQTITAGDSATIQVALTGSGPWRITWSPDGAVQNNIGSSPASRIVSPSTTTTYSISAVSDAVCAGTVTGVPVTITVLPACVPPTPSINAAGEVCPSSSGNTASVTPVTGATYQWTITNGTITSGATSASMQYTAGASGSVVLSVSVSNSCGSGSNTKSVVVGPTAQITSGNQTIAAGDSTTIQVALTGSAPWSITWSPDGAMQNNIGSSPASRIVSPSTTTTYSISAVSDALCAGTVTGTPVTITVLAAPTGFSTWKASNNSKNVLMQWNLVSWATSYRVERAAQIGAWSQITPSCQQIGNVMQCTDSFSAVSIPSPVSYVYRVKAVANGVASNPSSIDYATVADQLFSDEPLQATASLIRGIHVSELRAAIDAVRYAANKPRKWWPNYSPQTGLVLAVQFYDPLYANNLSNATDLRNVLNEAVLAIRGTTIGYTPPAPAAGGSVLAYQVEEIRGGVK